MAFGISQSVRSREVQVCTPELFHQATKSSRVKDVCAQIEDALERKRRGEIGQEDYDTMKTRLSTILFFLRKEPFYNQRQARVGILSWDTVTDYGLKARAFQFLEVKFLMCDSNCLTVYCDFFGDFF